MKQVFLLLVLCSTGASLFCQTPDDKKMKFLIHITQGPENPTRAALGLLVARTAIEEGHTVFVFLAGDAVQLLRNEVIENLAGLGTGASMLMRSLKAEVNFIYRVCRAR